MSHTNKMKYGTAAGLIISFSALMFLGLSGGITGVTQKNGDGCTCHNANPASEVAVRISGPDTLTVGQKGTFRITVKGGPLAAAGTNISAFLGVLDTIPGQGLQVMNSELTHRRPKVPVGDSVTFTFSYTAPASPGVDTLYANGNSVNLSNSNVGDQWNFAPRKTIRVKAVTAVSAERFPTAFALEQNYPNPFNPATTIRYTLPSQAHVRLDMFDISGRQVATLVDEQQGAGIQAVVWSPANLPSGTYLYRIEAGSLRETRKALFVK